MYSRAEGCNKGHIPTIRAGSVTPLFMAEVQVE
jgi:hypothetical protein